MAPELAIAELHHMPRGSIVLDPMSGSGTVLRHAAENGHSAIGYDVDPMAVLISRVWTTPVDDDNLEKLLRRVRAEITALGRSEPALPWIDEDEETTKFVRYWFGRKQRSVLRRLAYVLAKPRSHSFSASRDVLRLAMSRIIITKDRGASLGRDISHSRPHKVAETSDFDVMEGFERAVLLVRRLLLTSPPPGRVKIELGDARRMSSIANGSIDVVLTSPPYLNAIDYIRGHRLALVWLGYKVSELRIIRSGSIGTERGSDGANAALLFADIVEAMAPVKKLASRHLAMVTRYAEDVYRVMSETARVLRPGGRAVLVVGNSCLRDVFIRNANGVARAGGMVGLSLESDVERKLPESKRYLPMPSRSRDPLGRRMRTESVLSLRKT